MKKACRVHEFAADGKCSQCGKRRPGRPKNPNPIRAVIPNPTPAAMADAMPAASQPPKLPASATDSFRQDRAARLQSLFSPPPPVVAAPAAPPEPEPEPKPKSTTTIEKHDWPWAAGIATEGLDVGSGWAIEHWSDVVPLEASEASRKRFAKALGTFGEQKLGKVEVPTWIVLLICLVALLVSKIVGAPRKSDREAARAARQSAAIVPPVPVPTAAPLAPDPVPVAAGPAIVLPPRQSPPETTDGGGSVGDAQVGF